MPGVQAARATTAAMLSAARSRGPARPRSGCMGLGLGFDAAAGGADRHGDAEMRPRKLAVDDLHAPAMGCDELDDDRQADARALDRRALGGATGVEGIEDVAAVLDRDARTCVGDVEHQLRSG